MNLNWIVDPKDNKPSVTLTILVAATLLSWGAILASLLGFVKSEGVNLSLEFLWSWMALYYGRRTTFFTTNKRK